MSLTVKSYLNYNYVIVDYNLISSIIIIIILLKCGWHKILC